MTQQDRDPFMNDIAIIGMEGRFPGAANIEEFWQNLRDGKESITFFSDEELLSAGIDARLLSQSNFIKAKPLIDNVELFDATFFGFSPRDAELIDPQHRIFLEVAWHALERAGYGPGTCPDRVGVYAGSRLSTYRTINIASNSTLMQMIDTNQVVVGNENDYLTTLTSYKLDLKGPSINVQTACSTSLVAVHLACQSLLNGECDMALAGGVSIRLPQMMGYFYQEGNIVSPDGHCRSFDADAHGTVFGNGLGVVVLKRLSDALADNDTICAVIKGSAVNNDGAWKIGYMAPSVDGQAAVIAEGLAVANIDPATIGYVEAHGTATSLGDPIEIEAITQAFHTTDRGQEKCALGSVKSNIGHLDRAAGVAGLIKAILTLQHEQIPPSLHFKQANPKIDFDNGPFYVNTALTSWEKNGHPRRASVSSFGIGGTNAFAVIEEAPSRASVRSARPWQLLVFSAKTPSALATLTTNMADYLEQHPNVNLADVAYTLQVGRSTFSHQCIYVCQTVAEAARGLKYVQQARDPGQMKPHAPASGSRPVAFLFPGQGTQYVNMAKGLYQTEPAFRKQVDLCVEYLKPHIGLDLQDILYPADQQEAATEYLQQTRLTQPALFVIEYALAMLWIEWGVKPEVMIGHSIGEYVAACLAGVFTVEDALFLVAARGRLMQELPPGAMISVRLSENEVRQYLHEDLALASINAPSLCVLSGTLPAIEEIKTKLKERNVDGLPLHTSHAFHSSMMNPILDQFRSLVAGIQLHPPAIPYISNVTGTWITPQEATDPAYWAKHLRHTVCFAAGMQEIMQDTARIVLEVGPGRTLSMMVNQYQTQVREMTVLHSLHNPREQIADEKLLLTTLGKLWLAGININWQQFSRHEQRSRIPLPLYPFERKRYWIDMPISAPIQVDTASHEQQAASPQQESESSLALYSRTNISTSYVAPRTKLEKDLTKIWREALGIDQIGVDDNFFDLGGHSITAVQIAEQMGKVFGSELPMWSVFDEPTIAQQIAKLAPADQEITTVVASEHTDANQNPLNGTLENLDHLSDEDVENLLRQMDGDKRI